MFAKRTAGHSVRTHSEQWQLSKYVSLDQLQGYYRERDMRRKIAYAERIAKRISKLRDSGNFVDCPQVIRTKAIAYGVDHRLVPVVVQMVQGGEV